MKKCSYAYVEIFAYAWLVAHLEPVVETRSGCVIVVDSEERIAKVEVAAIFDASLIVAVVIWHQIMAIVCHVFQCNIPFAYFNIHVKSSREDVVPYVLSVVLESLEITYGE